MPYALLYAHLNTLTYPLLGPAPFPDCEEHELKSFRYAYVSFFFAHKIHSL